MLLHLSSCAAMLLLFLVERQLGRERREEFTLMVSASSDEASQSPAVPLEGAATGGVYGDLYGRCGEDRCQERIDGNVVVLVVEVGDDGSE